jgi:hypothetical protein
MFSNELFVKVSGCIYLPGSYEPKSPHLRACLCPSEVWCWHLTCWLSLFPSISRVRTIRIWWNGYIFKENCDKFKAVASLIIQIRQHSEVRVTIVPHSMYGNLNQGFRLQFFPFFIVTDLETGGLNRIGENPRHQSFKLDVLMGQHGRELCCFFLYSLSLWFFCKSQSRQITDWSVLASVL